MPSAVLTKAIMAVTGLLLFGWIFGHMFGNLKIFFGRESFNHYAEYLREMGSPLLPATGLLWIIRFGLLAAVVLHVWAATSLTLQNRRARPVGYRQIRPIELDYAARTMRMSGYLLAVYIVYHLLHLTFGSVHPGFVPSDPYANVVMAFQALPVSAVYIFANLLLGLHLYHGLWSLFQSLGWSQPAYNPWRRRFAATFAVLITVGFVSVPLAVLAGIVS
ncbi:MAG TPA: succinate dehydrogenase cytochrome b subunit [Vicinamibacteria bacterium]|nr:succinate dehydrogenase cytochrome b subunit [Vicinamibacteria bacterium]